MEPWLRGTRWTTLVLKADSSLLAGTAFCDYSLNFFLHPICSLYLPAASLWDLGFSTRD